MFCFRFCSRHGPNRHQQYNKPPADLLAIAEAMLPRVILRLIHHMRDSSNVGMYTYCNKYHNLKATLKSHT